MKDPAGLPSPEHVLEMLYHRELGYGLHDGADTAWAFRSAFKALGYDVSDADLDHYRNIFIAKGYGKFDGKHDPAFRISNHGETIARRSIARRKSWSSVERLRSYDWTFIAGVAAIVAAVLSFLALFKA